MNRFTLLFIGLACCLVANAQSGHWPQVPVLNAAWPATSAKSETVRDAKATGLLRDVMVEFPEVVPTILPAILIDGMPVTTQVTNLGSEAVSGKVTLSLGGNEVATGDFIDLAAGDSVLLQMTMAAGEDVALGKTTLDATAELSDGEDEDVSDNTASEKVTVSDGEFAYDHTNASMYVDNNALGLPNYEHSLYANSFYVPNTVMLDAVSVGYGRIEGDKVGVFVWEWNADTTATAEGYYPLGEQIYFYTHDQGTSRGIHEYELVEPVRLEPGHYMVGVSFAGWGIATDLTQPNQMYSIFADSLGVFAVDWASYELGTAAIRTHVSVAPPLGIDETVSGAADNVTIIVSGNSLVVDGGSSEVNSLSIYSLSGVVLDEVKGMGNVCRYDLSAMTCGVYIVKAVTANGISTRKFAVR